MQSNTAASAGSLVTAALIVRDEAHHLPDCLTSLRNVVDDIVVVDTGSVDDSPAIAAAYGARVYHRPWDGDFAAARNAALDRCESEWILYIDADERLDPVERTAVDALLADAPEVAFRLLLRPWIGSTPYREYRLWRNDPRIRFEGAIHEKVVPAIHAVAEADDRPIGTCDLLLNHVGYEGDQTRKHLRNLPLLRRQVKAEPGNLFNWHHLARVLAGLGRERQSERVLRHAVGLARAKPFADPNGVLAYSDLIAIRHDRGEDVTELLAEARGKYPRNCVLVWQEARALMAAGRYDDAIADWDWLLAVDVRRLPDEGPAYDERLFTELAYEGRGLCLFRLGRYQEAAAAYAGAERGAPDDPAYPVKRKLALARARRQREALSRSDVRDGNVLILTPVKNASAFLDTYFAALSKLSYPPELISLGFLESDSHDETYELIAAETARLSGQYRRVGLWQRDFGFELPEDRPRWAPEFQPERRAALARSRNHLLSRALADEDWVLWLDVDVIDYPADIIERLLATGKDIVHPHCMVESRYEPRRTFDLNAWRNRGKLQMDDLRAEGDLVRLDAVGGTMLLVRADAHRDGLVFPPFLYGRRSPLIRDDNSFPVSQGEIETEGLGVLASDMGYECWGMPNLEILHHTYD